MPRNVVILVPRRFVFPRRRNRTTRESVWAAMLERYRARVEQDPERIEFDFPKNLGRRAARDEVIQTLDEIDSHWRRVFSLYPRESNLR